MARNELADVILEEMDNLQENLEKYSKQIDESAKKIGEMLNKPIAPPQIDTTGLKALLGKFENSSDAQCERIDVAGDRVVRKIEEALAEGNKVGEKLTSWWWFIKWPFIMICAFAIIVFSITWYSNKQREDKVINGYARQLEKYNNERNIILDYFNENPKIEQHFRSWEKSYYKREQQGDK